jgi:hypothetical protein
MSERPRTSWWLPLAILFGIVFWGCLLFWLLG